MNPAAPPEHTGARLSDEFPALNTAPAAKEELRKLLRARRRQLGEEELAGAAEALSNQVLAWLEENRPGSGGTVAAYLSVPPEPGTARLLPGLREAGYNVVVPVCEPHYQLSWVHWEAGIELVKSPRAPLLEPVGRRYHFTDLEALQLVLVPGLAIDARGNRIGQGGGYYDRFLAQLRTEQPETPTLGYLYDEEVLPDDSIEATVLDMPLTGAFTPRGLRELG